MVSSGTYNFAGNFQIADCVTEAFERLGVFGEQVSGDMLTSAMKSLNFMFASWNADGSKQFAIENISYSLPLNTTSFSAIVGTYDIIDMSIRENGIDIGMSSISREEYLFISNKGGTGKPCQYFVDKSVYPCKIYLYPIPNNANFTIFYNRLKVSQDVIDPSNTLGITPWWFEAITAGLTARLAEKFRREMFAEKTSLADREYRKASQADGDKTSVRVRSPYRFG